MTAQKQQEVIEWAIKKIASFEKEKKLYNWTAIALSFLDVVCGVITIFYAGMLMTSVVASIICGTVWGARVIQCIKVEKLAKAIKTLRVANTVSLSYIIVRKRRSEFMQNTKIRNIIIGILTVLGFASVIVCNFVAALQPFIDYAIYYMCALLPVDMYAVFNNARMSAQEIEQKAQAKQVKQAQEQAKKELKEKQEEELKALTEQKLLEVKANAEKAEQEAKPVQE